MAIVLFSTTSCSKDSIEEMDSANLSTKVPPVVYSDVELDVLELVNAYRAQKGLTELAFLDESSKQAASHNQHMIANDEVCHHDFASRYQALVNRVQAHAVSENVAFGYRTAEAAVNAWMKSEGHRVNMEGNHTHFGVSVKEGKDGRLYFTNIFVRK